MSFWVYILRCADGSYYTGHTDNLEKRIGEHQTGACGGYTVTRLPVDLAWSQECVTREEALSAEMQVKGWSRKKKEAMMQGNWQEVNRQSRDKHRHQRLITDAPTFGAPLHASTSLAMPATLSTNGAVDADRAPLTSVRPEPPTAQLRTGFASAQDKLCTAEPKSFQNPPPPVRPERSAAKSKGYSLTGKKL